MTTTVTVEENNVSINLSDGVSPSPGQLTLIQALATLTGLVNFNGAGGVSAILIKLDGTTAPGANDDSGDGYTVGSIWVDTTNDNAYICTDATLGAANWEQINGGGGSSTWGSIGGNMPDQIDLQTALNGKETAGAAATVQGNLTAHTGNTFNPHLTTAAQVGAQASNVNLSAIAALNPANDDVLQRKAGAWTNRTMAQLLTDVGALPIDANVTTARTSGYTFQTSDRGATIPVYGTFTFSLPDGMPVGAQAFLIRTGAGTVTLAAATTLVSSGTQLSQDGAGATVVHLGSNVWYAFGKLT